MVTEEKPDTRPKCGYKVEVKLASGGTTRQPCGSEDGLRQVTGNSPSTGRELKTPVCEKHRLDAWRTWNVTGEDPIR